MQLAIDHTIVPSHDQESAARFIAKMFGLSYDGKWSHFSPVKVGELSLDFDNREQFEAHHYAFLAGDEEFDAILGRVQAEGIKYGSGPFNQEDMQINHLHGGRGFYFKDANGHSWEVITHTYV
ncbi:MAG TPA: VOC family protein [Dehalococcoidia bacterium]|nr:VOC family protein [Dehalococcoidia bacterium]